MATCPLCEKTFIDRRGLHGHFRFVHGIEYGSGRPAKKTALTEATREVIERKRGEKELIDRVKRGEFELIPRSEIRVKYEGFGGKEGNGGNGDNASRWEAGKSIPRREKRRRAIWE